MPLTAIAFALVAQQPHFARLTPVPFTQVEIKDRFWAPKQEVNRRVSLPHSLDMLEESGTIHNFELAAQGARTGFKGFVFMDSDAYKSLEAISFSLATHPDPVLEKRVDAVIATIAKAQMPDGYIDTYYEINAPDKRFTNLRDNHELYCMGHLIEAGVAHHRATGKRTLLDVAIKAANKIDSVFGEGKRMGYPGHPELELALVKLANETGDQRYFNLAKFFVSNRGSKYFAIEHKTPLDQYDGTYWQDQVPIRDQETMVGHAVRDGYLLSGVTDVMAKTEDPGLVAMVDRVWSSATGKRMYVTGGIGASGANEGFTTDYDLPNFTAYQETCASVAMAMWNERLANLYGDSKYADLMELALYNGVLAGGSLDGTKYFYVNPLASRGGHHRSGWFSCACCPPNEARTLASIGGYAYAWDNRTPGEMQVWIPTVPPTPVIRGLEGMAEVSVSYLSGNAQPEGVNDGSEPKSSGEQPEQLCHWWPHKGTQEWVQYTWERPQTLSHARAYFFDDTGRGECRYPDSWHLEYRDGSAWKPVVALNPYETKGDKWNEVSFQPISTTAMRLVVKMKEGWAAGVRQWQVSK